MMVEIVRIESGWVEIGREIKNSECKMTRQSEEDEVGIKSKPAILVRFGSDYFGMADVRATKADLLTLGCCQVIPPGFQRLFLPRWRTSETKQGSGRPDPGLQSGHSYGVSSLTGLRER